ncbi:hypothetical protein GCM10017687_17060 [Streptomyces echinatus]
MAQDTWLNTVAACAEDNHRQGRPDSGGGGDGSAEAAVRADAADAMLLALGAEDFAALPDWLARDAA